MTVCLVDLDLVLEALGDFLGKTNLFFGHQFVWQALGLGTLSSLLCLRSNDLLR